MTGAFERDPATEVESAALGGLFDGLMRDPRFAVGSKAADSVVVKHIQSGLQYLVELRALPLGGDDGDG